MRVDFDYDTGFLKFRWISRILIFRSTGGGIWCQTRV